MKKKHRMHWETIDNGSCHQWGCSGHRKRYLVCSCGFREEGFIRWDDPRNEFLILSHRSSVIEQVLGFSFSFDAPTFHNTNRS